MSDIERFPTFTHTRTGREKQLHDATLDVVKALVDAKKHGEFSPPVVELAVSRLALLFGASDEMRKAMGR